MRYQSVSSLPLALSIVLVCLPAYPVSGGTTNNNVHEAKNIDVASNKNVTNIDKTVQVGQANVDPDAMDYRVQPGDVLFVSVWKEPDLQRDVLVSPGGRFFLPLIGDLDATNKTLGQLKLEVTDKLKEYIPDVDVTVALKQILGNKVFVIGKVNRPGEFVINQEIDVLKALSMAGGTTQFADVGDIIILRREKDDQRVFKFDYDDVKRGKNLRQNIILKSGDTVVVP